MRFYVTGASRDTARDVRVIFQANTAEEAEAIARRNDILVESVWPIPTWRSRLTKKPVLILIIGGLLALAMVVVIPRIRQTSSAEPPTAAVASTSFSDFCALPLSVYPDLNCDHYKGALAMATGLMASGYADSSGGPIDHGRLRVMLFTPNHFHATSENGFKIEWRVQAKPGTSSFMRMQNDFGEHSSDLYLSAYDTWSASFVYRISLELSGAGLETLSAASEKMLSAIATHAKPTPYAWQRQYAARKRVGDYVVQTMIQSNIESERWETDAWSRVWMEFIFDPERKNDFMPTPTKNTIDLNKR